MGRKLVLLAAFILVPLVAAADYTMVLRDGRRIVAREKYVVDQGVVRFVGTDGQSYQFALTEVDLAATERANAPPEQRSRKFIWTNDEIERLGLKGRINIVGPRPAEPAPPPAEAEAEATPAEGEPSAAEGEPPKPLPPREKDPETYRERLRPLRSELAQVERQIADLQTAVQGSTGRTAGMGLTTGNPGVDPRDTLRMLQRRLEQIHAQIAAIEAEARRNGLSPGQIR